MLIMKTMCSYLPARVQSAQKLTAGLKGETWKQEAKFSAAKNLRGELDGMKQKR